jgi:hypothetical protein
MQYCVYITEYFGQKMPKFYVGSSNVKKVKSGYRGSVSSKKYCDVWKQELLSSPELFATKIVSYHENRKSALEAELLFQIENDVVKSKDWINLSYSRKNGMFGMDVSGKNNPMYGKSRKGEKHQGGDNISKSLQKFFSDETRSLNHRRKSSERLKNNNPSKDPEVLQKCREIWKKTSRGIGSKNGMYGKKSPMNGKKLYNDGITTKCFAENQQPDGWKLGRA